jgi:excisionase family DNA binding protein
VTTVPALLTTTEAAAYLTERGVRVSDETLRRWAKDEKVRHIRLPSGQVRFRPDDLEELASPIEPTEAAS